MKSVKFLGAAGMVTGSSYLLTGNTGRPLLIDFGMFQGSPEITALNMKPLGFNPEDLEAVILTHAHLDHAGRLPLLSRNHFSSNIYMTEPTKVLSELTLYDSAKIAQSGPPASGGEGLYTEFDVDKVLGHMRVVKYEEGFEVGEFRVLLKDAGHILGSASILITEKSTGEKIVFSGDLGNTPQMIEKPTEYFDDASYVVMESTYGDKAHPNEDPKEIIKQEINAVEKSGGALLIPAFSLERTQVLLHMIDHLKQDSKVRRETKVFLDSPMGIKATEIYKSYPELYSERLAEHTKGEDPFSFPGLEIVERDQRSRRIHATPGAKVIIAGSGMMSGGRILRHLTDFLDSESTRLLIVGYQAEGTLGREIEEGAKVVEIKEREVEVNANITEIKSMSAHADQPRLLDWLSHIKNTKKIFLTHGDNPQRRILSDIIKEKNLAPEVYLPSLDEEIAL